MDSLPDELVCRICDGLSGSDLVNFSRLSRKFSCVARTALYSHCKLIPLDQNLQLRTLRRMLDSLVDTPALGSLVHGVELPGSKIDSIAPPPFRPGVGVGMLEIDAIKQLMDHLLAGPYECWRAFGVDLRESSQDAMVIEILMSLPNLKSLTFGQRYKWADRWEDQVHDRKAPLREDNFTDTAYPLTLHLLELSVTPEFAHYKFFNNLSCVTLVGCQKLYEEDDGWSFSAMTTFLKLPSLRQFSAGGFRDMDEDDEWDCGEDTSSVTDINLFNNRISPESMGKVLRSCKALERFRCERLCRTCGRREWEDDDDVIYYRYDYDCSYTGVELDLFRHRKSLRYLALNTKACDHRNNAADQPIKSLAALKVLEYLEVDEDVFWGCRLIAECLPLTAILPVSLKTLVVVGETQENGLDTFHEYGRLILSETHCGISAVEARRTSAGFFDDHRYDIVLPGVSVKEIEDPVWWHRALGDLDNWCGILLYRSEQLKHGGESEGCEQEDVDK